MSDITDEQVAEARQVLIAEIERAGVNHDSAWAIAVIGLAYLKAINRGP